MKEDELHTLREAIGVEQATNMAEHHIILALVRRLAERSGDPRQFLSELYEDVARVRDRFPVTDNSVMAETFRFHVDKFFEEAGKPRK